MALSFEKFTGTGFQTQFAVNFAYISKLHVFVFVDGVSVPFVFVNNALIQTTTAPALDSVVEVRRDTPIAAPLVDFEDGGTLSELDLDLIALQGLFHNQEQADDIDNSLKVGFDQEWDAQDLPMRNLADPSTPTNVNQAINLGFLNTALIGSANVPVPLNPTDDGKTLIAASGSWSWATMLVANLADVGAVMKTFLKSATLAVARTNLGLGTAAVLNQGTGASDLPANSDLGSASLKDTGLVADTIPLLTATGMPAVKGDKMLFPDFDSAFNENQGTAIASVAGITDIGAATGNFVDVTGTNTITGLGTVAAGTERTVRFTGILTITHHAVSLICLSGANIITAVDDIAVFRSLGAGNWVMVDYVKKDGKALVLGASAAFKGVSVKLTTDEVIPTGTGKDIPWDVVIYDTTTFWSSGAATRLTIPAGVTRVKLNAGISWLNGPGTDMIIEFQKNGARFDGMGHTRVQDGSTIGLTIASGVVDCVATDYFELFISQGSGSNKSLRSDIVGWTFFSLEVVE